MNLTQKRFAMNTVQEILNRKKEEAKKKLTVKPTYLSSFKRLELIRSGKVRLRTNKELKLDAYRYGGGELDRIRNVYDFSKFENPHPKQVALNKRLKKLCEEARRINKEIMLGDEKKALKALNAFERF